MLESHDIIIEETVDARKTPLTADAAWELVQSADQIMVGKGRNSQTFDPQTDSQADILKAIIGRSGNLRAPTIKIGQQLIVGYNDKLYGGIVESD